MEINRTGRVTEYKKGHFYLTHTQWKDGHCEIEIHKCEPKLIVHSCDQKDLPTIESVFASLTEHEHSQIGA